METKTCLVCGNEFRKNVSQTKWEQAKFCSRACYYKSKHNNEKLTECICKNCGKRFILQSSRVSNGRGIHCSKECFRQTMLKGQHGPDHPSWKGGIFERGGYRFIWKPNHLEANNIGYVREHRLVMEKKLGRLLQPNEIVHHINHDRLDNRIENLMLMGSNSEHKRFHDRERKKI